MARRRRGLAGTPQEHILKARPLISSAEEGAERALQAVKRGECDYALNRLYQATWDAAMGAAHGIEGYGASKAEFRRAAKVQQSLNRVMEELLRGCLRRGG